MLGKYKFCKAFSLKKVLSNHWLIVKKDTSVCDTSENVNDVKTLFNLSPKSITMTESKFTLPKVCLCSNSLSSCLSLYNSDFSNILILLSRSFFLS